MEVTLAHVKKLDRQNKLPELRKIADQQDERWNLIQNRDRHLTIASHSRGDEKSRHLIAAAGFAEKLRSLPGSRAIRRFVDRALDRKRRSH